MRIRVIEFSGYVGGVASVMTELLRVLSQRHDESSFEVVGHGRALARLRERIDSSGIRASTVAMTPSGFWRRQRLPESEKLGQLAGYVLKSVLTVPDAAFDGCDVAWLPNIQRHCIPNTMADRTVVTLHDLIPLQFSHTRSARANNLDRDNLLRWLDSKARIVCDSETTRDVAVDMFGVPADRFTVVYPGFDHARIDVPVTELAWEWARRPYILYPAHAGPSKNHETLFRGVGAWGAKHPLVLTGYGANLPPIPGTRLTLLRRVARESGLRIGSSLFPLGFVSHREMYGLLSHAWALVTPSLAEGFGLPVLEAMVRGIPVIASDIPAIREQVRRTGGHVLWFDPRDPLSLAARLAELDEKYDEYKARAVSQVPDLRIKGWDEVADEYWSVFETVANGPARR